MPRRSSLMTARLGAAVVQLDPLTVAAVAYTVHPIAVGQVPVDRLAQSGLERLDRPPSEFALDLARIDRVPKIVSWSVLDELNLRFVSTGLRTDLVEHRADRLDHVDVAALG